MSSNSNYNLHFKEELNKLNTEQLEAVKHIEGPVLVIAGPGTGKTQILSARVGNILASQGTQARPNNILCLTYTEAGVIAMRERLLKLIGTDAYRVNVFTFHAFCNDVIQNNLDHFGIRDLEPVSDLEHIKILKKLIDSFGPKHLLKRFTGDVYFEIPRLRNLFKLMKEENWSAEYMSRCIDSYLAGLPDRAEYKYKKKHKQFNAGDINQNKLNIEIDKINLTKAAVNEFSNYQNLMLEHKRYDYSDMIQWVIKMFKEDQNVLIRYQEQFLYFLVDEYQDTNGAQNEILNLLINYWDKPNVFVVGDDDQSIYRFQGANVKNIVDFHDKYAASLKKIILKKNYRSSQNIINSTNFLIQNNKQRLIYNFQDLDKTIVAASDEFANSQVMPEVIEYCNITHEEAGIIKTLEELRQSQVNLSDVAVIYRLHKQVDNIIKILEYKKFPLNVKKKVDVFKLPFTTKIITLLKYLSFEFESNNESDRLLFELMHFDFFDINPMDIVKISRACHNKETNQNKLNWRETISSKENLFQLNVESIQNITELANSLNHLIANIPNITLQQLFEKVITRLGILAYIMKSPEKIWLMQVLTTLFDFMKEETTKSPQLTLKYFLETLDEMQQNKLTLSLNKQISASDGVNFVTAHSAKGLEFKYVYLIGCTAKIWKDKEINSTYALPDTLFPSNASDDAEESRRLFYVALTRAKEHLVVSYAGQDKDDKQSEKSSFIAEITQDDILPVNKITLPENELLSYYSELMLENEPPVISQADKEYIDSLLKSYRMSLTHLNNFLECPLKFYFENIVKVPSSKNQNTGFGSAVHYAMEQLFNRMKARNNIFPSKAEFYQIFVEGIYKNRNAFTDQQLKLKLEYGKEILPSYYDKYFNSWNKITVLEYNINHVEVDGVPIRGVIDKIEFDGNNVNVVDYKTGKYENAKPRLKLPDDKDPLGGKYWRQIIFYKILMDNDKRKPWKMLSGELDFIEKHNKDFVKEKFLITSEEVQIVKSQIKEVYQKIMIHEFYKGCGEEDCQWCSFVKHNYNKSFEMEPDEEQTF